MKIKGLVQMLAHTAQSVICIDKQLQVLHSRANLCTMMYTIRTKTRNRDQLEATRQPMSDWKYNLGVKGRNIVSRKIKSTWVGQHECL